MKHLRICLILTIFAILISACSSAAAPVEPTPTSAALVDGLGVEFSSTTPATRIVSLAPSNTELVYAVGAGDLLVGRDEFSDYPAEAKQVESVGGSNGVYDLEKIASLQPDLVLAGEINSTEFVDSIKALGINVYYVANPDTLEGMYDNLRAVARLTGHDADAETLIASLQQRVSTVETKLAGVTERPVVFYEFDATDPAKPYTSGPGTFYSSLIQLAGGQNLGDQLDSSWAQISLEEILVANPNIIILGDAAYGETPEKVAQRTGWGDLQAVKDGKIYAFDDNLISRPGPRLVDGLEALAKLLHPEAFGE